MMTTAEKKLTRGDTFIAGGVCAGLANYYGLNKGGVQAAFVISSLFFGLAVLVYVILWCFLPKESQLAQAESKAQSNAKARA